MRTVPSLAPVAIRWYDRPQDGAHATDVSGEVDDDGVRCNNAVGEGSNLMICHECLVEMRDAKQLTRTVGFVPVKTASTLPHHFSRHQLRPHAPCTCSPGPSCPAALSSVEPGAGRDGTWMSCADVQSFKDGSREVYILRCESVDIAACHQRISNPVVVRMLTSLKPKAGFGGENSTARTLPFAPPSTALSAHRPSFALDAVVGSSHILTVRSCPHDARREPWIGCAKDKRRSGASWAWPVNPAR